MRWLRHHKKPILIGFGSLIVLMVAVQVLYPGDRLLPFARIDGQTMSMWQQKDAIYELNRKLNTQPIELYLNDETSPVGSIKPSELGLSIDNVHLVTGDTYPLLLRFVPTSLLWYGMMQKEGDPVYQRDTNKAQAFIDKQFGKQCVIAPQNATIVVKDASLEVVSAKDGGTCQRDDVIGAINTLKPHLEKAAHMRVHVATTKPTIQTDQATKLAETINKNTGETVPLRVAETSVNIPRSELFSWLEFRSEKSTLLATLSAKKASDYLAKNIQPKVAKPAGVTQITTRDFTTISRKNGASGVALNNAATLGSLTDIMLGKATSATAQTTTLKPAVRYTRTYSKSSLGVLALITHYDQDHSGVFGVSFHELGGNGLSAEYNSNQVFHTASTYKLFVAYDTLRKIEKKDWSWTDNIVGGQTIAQCFDLMITHSDNTCAEALYKKIGYQKTINDARALGLSHTTLAPTGQQTSASDLGIFLTKLQNGTIGLSASSRATLLDAMKRNVYRQGVPAGASGTTADKVGFLNGLLHDAAIVYSPKGTYVLAVMSDGSSWGAIADLTKKIEALR